jgi:imidazoleglycerol-phosphate dehydratase/histidinol-phosphatase
VRGENTHHMVEVSFKALARALRQAFKREGDELPTTKGTL